MAKVEITNMTDDLDETVTDGVETVSFFDPESGVKVELELGEKNAKALTKAIAGLEKYLAVARKVEAPKPAKAVKATGNQAKVREWAQANGFKVGDRGRIKADIVEAYEAAQVAVAMPDTKAQTAEPVTALTDSENVELVEVDEPETVVVESTEKEYSDAEILALMAEVEAEHGEVKFEDLLDKAAEDN